MGKVLRPADSSPRCAADHTCTQGGRAYGHVPLPCEMRGPYSGGRGPEDPPPSFVTLSVLLWALRPHRGPSRFGRSPPRSGKGP